MPDPATEGVFEGLYSAHRQALHAYFFGKTGDAELALDLMQETFVRVWRNLATMADLPADRQRAWLFTIARNLVVDEYRSRSSREAALQAYSRTPPEGRSPALDDTSVERERVEALDSAIRRLPEDLRTVLVLQIVGELSSAEVGELLGRPAGTVRYQLAQARRRLAEDLELVEAITE